MQLWNVIVSVLTFYLPNFVIKEYPQREKIALNILIHLFGITIVFTFGILPVLVCESDTIYTTKEAKRKFGNDPWVIFGGKFYSLDNEYLNKHPGGVKSVKLQSDITLFFNRKTETAIATCLHANTTTPNACQQFTQKGVKLISYCHNSSFPKDNFKQLGSLALTTDDLNSLKDTWIIIRNNVYIIPDKNVLDNLVLAIVEFKIKENATVLFEENFESVELKNLLRCMDNLFLAGVIDIHFNVWCFTLNIFILVCLSIVIAVMLSKFLISLLIQTKKGSAASTSQSSTSASASASTIVSASSVSSSASVIINIPCYNESKEELQRTIDSVCNLEFSQRGDKVLLFIVVDGIIGKTPNELLSIFNKNFDSPKKRFKVSNNFIKLYSGIHNRIPYIILIKMENRGKRDSQLLLLNFLNKVFYKEQLTLLEKSISDRIKSVTSVNPIKFKYLFMIDSDTVVSKEALTEFLNGMELSKERVLGMCGETRVRNKYDSWITTIQVYEYYISYYLSKAFESFFGSVMCLPGCFSFYRIYFDSKQPGVIKTEVVNDYASTDINTVYRKNLLSLGEDRYLTTLLLKHFPEKRLVFWPDAVCYTTVPKSITKLFIQRRRWINSTICNLIELIFPTGQNAQQLRGFCCFSMKLIVVLDLIGTFSLPAGIVYAGYLIYLYTKLGVFYITTAPFLLVLIVGLGTQILTFLLKRDYTQLLWLIAYTLALPVYHLLMPVYAWSKFDQFNWD